MHLGAVVSFHRGRILAGPRDSHKGEIFSDYPELDTTLRQALLWLGQASVLSIMVLFLVGGIARRTATEIPIRETKIGREFVEIAKRCSVGLMKLVEVIETTHQIEAKHPICCANGRSVGAWNIFQGFVTYVRGFCFVRKYVDALLIQRRTIEFKILTWRSGQHHRTTQVVRPSQFRFGTIDNIGVFDEGDARISRRKNDWPQNSFWKYMKGRGFAAIHNSDYDVHGFIGGQLGCDVDRARAKPRSFRIDHLLMGGFREIESDARVKRDDHQSSYFEAASALTVSLLDTYRRTSR